MGQLTYLLDTNVLSEPLASVPNPNVLAQIARHSDRIALSAVSWQEMLFGMCRLPPSRRRTQVEHYLHARLRGVLPILPFDEGAASWQAEERARLAAQGRPPAYADSQIAAIAAVNRLVLVTRNTHDFADFRDLRLEDWFSLPAPHDAS